MYTNYLPKLALEESGSSSTDNISESEHSAIVITASSTPSTPIVSDNTRSRWGHHRTWSTGVVPNGNKPSSYHSDA